MNLYDLFAIAGQRSPERVALSMPVASAVPQPQEFASDEVLPRQVTAIEWSYFELLMRAGALAEGLWGWGLRPGDRVACWLGNRPELVVLHLALLRLGAVLVPLNLAYRRREIGHILADAAPRLLVAETAQRELLAEVDAADRATLEAVLSVEDLAGGLLAGGIAAADETAAGGTGRAVALGGDQLAMLLYTSGTTGPSKGAMLSHNNLLATVTGLLAAWAWRADDRLLLTLPLFHVHGLVVGLDCALAAGATVELRRRFDAAAVVDELEGGVATLFFGVPTLYVRLVGELARRGAARRAGSVAGAAPENAGHADAAHGGGAETGSAHLDGGGAARGSGIAGMRLFCSGSAPLAPDTFAGFLRLTGHAILERYGMTETGMLLGNPYLGPRVAGEVGGPFPGVSVRVVDEAGGDVVAGETGELLVRGGNVFAGYWRAPDKTAASFVADAVGRRWFRTGDLARQDAAAGTFTLLGRRHELILSGGFNVYPREIEETLLGFPGVLEAAVVGRPHAEWGEVPVAYLVAAAPMDEAALLAHCRSQLAGFKVPREVRYVETLPRNALGKLQKHLLR